VYRIKARLKASQQHDKKIKKITHAELQPLKINHDRLEIVDEAFGASRAAFAYDDDDDGFRVFFYCFVFGAVEKQQQRGRRVLVFTKSAPKSAFEEIEIRSDDRRRRRRRFGDE
jgi:hypothetical protein